MQVLTKTMQLSQIFIFYNFVYNFQNIKTRGGVSQTKSSNKDTQMNHNI